MDIEQEEQSGFGEVFSDEPASVAALEEEQVTEPVVEAPEVVEPLPAISAEEFRALSERFNALGSVPEELRKVQGKYGELHRSMQQLQQPRGFQLDADKFTRLKANYPEITNDLVSDLNEALQVVGGNQAFDPAQFEEVISSRVTQATDGLSKQVQTLSLSLAHSDWKQVAASPEFQTWKSALPADQQNQLDSSWDAEFLADKITEFKATATKPAAAPSAKTKVIQAAVTPAGSRSAQPAIDSEADAFRRATSGA